ncbi:hypothetical protein FX985_06239 [Pseudomonas extremaustralis]|uniref:Uncharacterized protein n=1 Tax=Pseudomonas extremaustralis TaxID=359110 RepID=A0A5M9IVY2_9PSED|nr:hypothetical protein FX985_06239 [Pseudomonas extremaustralis]
MNQDAQMGRQPHQASDAIIATLWFAYVFIYKGPRP